MNPDPSLPPRSVNTHFIGGLMIGAGVVLVAVAIILLALNGSPAASGPPRVGAPLANFSLTDLSGKTVHLSDFAGHPVLINAWATWCPPCQEEMPDLNAYYQQYRSQGLVILAVNAGETAAQASAYAQQLGLTFPVLLDPDEHLMDVLHINDFPTSILVGRDGLVKAVYVGLMSRATIDAQFTPYLN